VGVVKAGFTVTLVTSSVIFLVTYLVAVAEAVASNSVALICVFPWNWTLKTLFPE
jgi:hypothetical protein